MTKTIDMTPTWEGILPMLLAAYEDGTPVGRQMAMEELTRLARIADAANELATASKAVLASVEE